MDTIEGKGRYLSVVREAVEKMPVVLAKAFELAIHAVVRFPIDLNLFVSGAEHEILDNGQVGLRQR